MPNTMVAMLNGYNSPENTFCVTHSMLLMYASYGTIEFALMIGALTTDAR